MKRLALASLALVLAAVARGEDPPAAKPAGEFHVTKTLKVGGDGRWDLFAVDSRTSRLYVPRTDHVLVVDGESGKIVGRIDGTNGVHGVALVPELERGFTSDGKDATMTVFDLKTLTVLAKVPAGSNPDAIVYEPVTKQVLCFNGKSHDVTAVDAAFDVGKPATTRRLELGGKPELAVSDDAGRVFVNLEDTSEVVRFDAKSMKADARFALAPCEEPTGIGYDAKTKRLFCACGNEKMAVLDAETGKVLATPQIGHGADGGGFDPASGTAFASCGDGTLTAIRETKPGVYDVVKTLETKKGARTMALDPTRSRVYLLAADFGPTPEATEANPRPRPQMIADSFVVLVVER